jgi:hypothetical protein
VPEQDSVLVREREQGSEQGSEQDSEQDSGKEMAWGPGLVQARETA